MRTPPTNWTTLMAQPHETETKLVVHDGNGDTTEYFGFDGTSGIYSCTTHPMLFDKMSVGNCCSSQIDLTLVNPQEIPRMAQMDVYVRLASLHAKKIRPYGEELKDIFRVMPTATRRIYYSSEIIIGHDDITDMDYMELSGDISVITITSEADISNLRGKYYRYGNGAYPPTFYWRYADDDAEIGYDTAPYIMARAIAISYGSDETDWVRKGTYFIDTREWDAQHEFLTITGYDAMLKAEQYYYTPPATIGVWPKADTAVVTEICQRIGVQLDSRTTLNKGYKVRMPSVSSDGKGSNTLREVLKWIGAAYGGNWCITDEGKLRLVPLVPTNTPIAIGTDAIDLNTSPQYDGIGIVHLIVGEDGEEYTAGSTGREIDVDARGMHFEDTEAVEEMADDVLAALQGYAYQPLTVTTAYEADPLWELGDKITVNGFTSQIAEMPTDFCVKYTVDITAGGEDEIDHEYPYQSTEKKIERKIASSVASIKIDIDSIDSRVTSAEGTIAAHTISIGQISSEVSGKITTYRQSTVPTGAHNGDLWYCTGTPTGYTANTWYRYNGETWDKTSEDIDIPVAPAWASGTDYKKGDVVDSGGAWYSAKINHTASSSNKPPNSTYWKADATISAVTKSQIDQLADSISLSVNQSSIVLTGNGISITAPTALLKVDAANITGTLTVGWSNVSGKPSFSTVATSGSYNDLSNKPSIPTDAHITTITGDYISTASIYAQNLEVKAANIRGTLSADQITTEIAQIASSCEIGDYGTIYATYSNGISIASDNGASILSNDYGSKVVVGSTGVNLYNGSGENIRFEFSYGDVRFIPMQDAEIYLGGSGRRWKQVWAETSTIATSDEKQKKDVEYDLSRYDALFDLLRPCAYRFIDGDSGRKHTGMIAQDIESALESAEISTLDFAAFIKTTNEEGLDYALRYEEFIALCIDQIQRLKARVSELEARA